MSEWWTYRPADFLMFAPRTYWRLFELHNQAWWPAHVLAVLAGLAILVGLWRSGPAALRFATGVLALGCAFVAWTFLWQRYAVINWAATGFAWAFGAQAVGLLVLTTRASLVLAAGRARRRVGLGLLFWAVLVHPLLALALGRPWVLSWSITASVNTSHPCPAWLAAAPCSTVRHVLRSKTPCRAHRSPRPSHASTAPSDSLAAALPAN